MSERSGGGTGIEQNLRLLLVEDDPDYAYIVRRMLQQSFGEDLVVDHVNRLDQARVRLQADAYDCALADLGLPDAGGLEVVRGLREAAAHVPIVVLTGLGDDGDGEAAVRAGAQDYLLKDRVKAADLRRSIAYSVERSRAAAVVRQSEERLQSLLAGVSDVILVVGTDMQLRYVSASVERAFGYAADDVGALLKENRLVHPDDALRARTRVAEVVTGVGWREPWEFRLRHADGLWRVVEAIASSVLEDPELGGVVITVRDVTERRRAEEEVVTRVAQQAMLADLGRQALTELDADDLLAVAAEMVATTLGVPYTAVLELDEEGPAFELRAGTGWPEDWRSVPWSAALTGQAGETLAGGGPVLASDLAEEPRFDVDGCLSVVIGGRERPFGVFAAAARGARHFSPDDVHFVQSVANLLAVALERRRTEEEVRHQALHDALTGLPNRAMLADRLELALAELGRSTDHAALLLMDLDGFKEVNDTLGHDVGDRVLCEIARRLARVVRNTDTVARLGGDEFAVLCTHLGSLEEAERVASKVLGALEQPCAVEGMLLGIAGSIGVAMAPSHGIDATTLLKRADVAMYRAKRSRAGYLVYSDELAQPPLLRSAGLAELRQAVEQAELVVHYQPKVDLRTHETVGVEALVRWRHPTRGLLAPDQFVPFAEQAGILRALSLWVLHEALGLARTLSDAGRPLVVSVNLSAHSLLDPTLPAAVAEALRETGVPASQLQLEIAETALLSDPSATLDACARLRERGVQLALDDFGIGSSSVAWLQQLPVSELKVDRSFVTRMDHDARDARVVRSVIELAHDLKMRVVAEGVETSTVLAELERLGCDYAQGYHLAHPVEAERLPALVDHAVRSAV